MQLHTPQLTLVPVGGLANRMKAIDAALALARETAAELRILWFRDWGLNCRFDQLFQPFTQAGVSVKEASWSDQVLWDRPRRRNLYLPRLFQQYRYDACLYEQEVTQRFYRHFDFADWLKQHPRAYLASCVYFHPQAKERLFQAFRPIEPLQRIIEDRTQGFDPRTWGVHIRRTDNVASIVQSPTDLFVQHMQNALETGEARHFYLATDSETDKAQLKQAFGEHLSTTDQPAVRNSVAGIQEALVELYTLSRTARILGSAQSSYSETAAQLSGIPCQILKA